MPNPCHFQNYDQAMSQLSYVPTQAASERYVIDMKGLQDDFEVEAEPAIDPAKWKVYPP